ncbi:MAG: DNA repair protein RecO [Acidobacteriota bacterium]
MEIKTTAFVLRTYPLAEADRIVVLSSRAAGKLRGVAPRAAASRKRFGGALSILSEVDLRYRMREGRDLGRLESCRLLAPTPGEGRDLEAFYACGYLAEILEQFSREGEADDALYRLTQASTRALAAGQEAERVVRYFEIWVLRLAGLLPDLEECPRCGQRMTRLGAAFFPGGEAVCWACAGSSAAGVRKLPPSAVNIVRWMLRTPPGKLEACRPSRTDLAAMAAMAAGQFLSVMERPFRLAGRVGSGRLEKPTALEKASP